MWLAILVVGSSMTYNIYKLKKRRLQREDTMFYKIYSNMNAQSGEEMSMFEQEKMITKIHSELLQIFDENELGAKFQESAEAVHKE